MELARVLGEFAIAAGVLAWLMRSLVGALLSKDLENHKAQLQAQAQAEVERLKFELNLIAQRRATEFSALHAKRAELIAELHPLLLALEKAVGVLCIRLDYLAARAIDSSRGRIEQGSDSQVSVTAGLGSYEKQLVASVEEAYRDFMRVFEVSKIYLPERLCASILRGSRLASRFSADFERHAVRFDALSTDDLWALINSLNSLAVGWQESLKIFQQEVRGLLGVREDGSTAPSA